MASLAVGCGGSERTAGFACDDIEDAAGKADGIGIAGEVGGTKAFSVADAPADGSQITWEPVYTLTNLTGERVCVRDVTTRFPEKRDQLGRTWVLKAAGASRRVEIFPDRATLKDGKPVAKRTPPELGLEPEASVGVRYLQHYALTIDGRPVRFPADGELVDYLGAYFVLREQEGRYQCVGSYSGLPTVLRSSLGTATRSLSQAIMPEGCFLVIPR